MTETTQRERIREALEAAAGILSDDELAGLSMMPLVQVFCAMKAPDVDAFLRGIDDESFSRLLALVNDFVDWGNVSDISTWPHELTAIAALLHLGAGEWQEGLYDAEMAVGIAHLCFLVFTEDSRRAGDYQYIEPYSLKPRRTPRKIPAKTRQTNH